MRRVPRRSPGAAGRPRLGGRSGLRTLHPRPGASSGDQSGGTGLHRKRRGLVALEQTNAGRGNAFRWSNVKQSLTNRMLLGVYLGQYCINVLTYFFVTWFPIYQVKERGLNVLEAGFAAAAPALCDFIGGVLGGHGSDWLVKRTSSLTIARKTPLLIGMLLATFGVETIVRIEMRDGEGQQSSADRSGHFSGCDRHGR